jgi:hypothetical protein
MELGEQEDRRHEWFVPSFGPLRFRIFVGLLFLPYTGMVLAFTVVGASLAETVHWDRVAALLVIYFLALGVGAHALDALGSRTRKPWGEIFPRRVLLGLAAASIGIAYAIGIWYIIHHAPLLAVIAVLEGFFLLAYNLEWFGGRFHTDGWFAFSWGALPVLAGYVLQTNSVSAPAVVVAAAMALLSLVEIKASRPYKELKRGAGGLDPASTRAHARRYEAILKSISLGVIVLALGLAGLRWSP